MFSWIFVIAALNYSTAQFTTFSGAAPYNTPCNAGLYDFGGDDNKVPCGPSANTTSQVAISGPLQSPHTQGTSNISAADLNCGTNGENYDPAQDVLWVSFIIQEGGSFEWQTVPGPDKFTWTLFYATDPVDMASEETSASGCTSLVETACGDQFTGWQVVSTPDPTKRWRFYLALYVNLAKDKDDLADGVVKIRKSCGLACEGDEPTVSLNDVCILSGSTTLDANNATGGGGAPYSYIWSDANGVLIGETSSTLTVSTAGTYTVVVTGANGCPGTAQAIVTTSGCCVADAGTISGLAQDETICNGALTFNGTSFSTDATPQPAGYSYAFFLVDGSGNRVGPAVAGTSTSFIFSSLGAGMYTVYGISYFGANAAAYVNGFNTLAEIQTDISGGTCAELVAHAFKVTVVGGGSCGTFPQP